MRAYLRAAAARLDGAWHALLGHDVRWHEDAEEGFCPGDIECFTCNPEGLVIWCRMLDPWRPLPER